jgi:cysteine-rich repeat protein
VRTGNFEFVSGTFSLDVDVSVPAQDCTPVGCVDVTCGDGLIRGDEQCDDGNTNDSDGCSAGCVAEPAQLCSGEPSSCVATQPGDRCDGAQPLVDDTYSLAGYTPEPTCQAVCGGASRWFSIDVPAWQTLRVSVSTTDVQAGGFAAISGDLPCWVAASFNAGGGGPSQAFGAALTPATQAYVNASPITRALVIAVWDQQAASSGSFTISHSLQPAGCGDAYLDAMGQFGAPEACDDGNHAAGDGCDASCHVEQGWDCSNGGCRPILCGDAVVSQGETCDDGNVVDEDGCSATCQIEPGYLCGGNPYACQAYQQGDLCSNALPLDNATYSLDGYLADLSCHDICSGSDRWFTFTLPSGSVFSAVISTDDLNGQFRVYDLTESDCNQLWNNVFNGNFDPMHASRTAFVNRSDQARTFAIAFYDAMPGQIGGSFHVQYGIEEPACGDGYVDAQGEFGPPEQCDDGNVLANDGCSPTCMFN